MYIYMCVCIYVGHLERASLELFVELAVLSSACYAICFSFEQLNQSTAARFSVEYFNQSAAARGRAIVGLFVLVFAHHTPHNKTNWFLAPTHHLLNHQKGKLRFQHTILLSNGLDALKSVILNRC